MSYLISQSQILKKHSILIAISVASIMFVYFRCTGNPIGDNNITLRPDQISGQVQLDNNGQPERVYVWLEGFDVGTFTDKDGSFSMRVSNFHEDVTGLFKLYFYVMNYKLDFVEVTLRNGEFLFGVTALNSKGELNEKMRMTQLLSLNTLVNPSSVLTTFNGTIEIETILKTIPQNVDTVSVVFPNTTGELLGPVFFRNIATNVAIPAKGILAETSQKIIVRVPVKHSGTLFFPALSLSPATYEVIPFVLVQHEEIPEELLNNIGSNLTAFTPNYLKLPFSRQGGLFEVR